MKAHDVARVATFLAGAAEGAVDDPNSAMAEAVLTELEPMLAKSLALVNALSDAEANHGGLVGVATLRQANELRLELHRWGTK
jgi:hypothetical protein